MNTKGRKELARVSVTVEFPKAPKDKKPKKVWHGEEEARKVLGKCFIYKNEIGIVEKIGKARGGYNWQVWYRHIRHAVSTSYGTYDGIEDGFSHVCWGLHSALAFYDQAVEVDKSVLLKAQGICKEAGDKIDELIKSALSDGER